MLLLFFYFRLQKRDFLLLNIVDQIRLNSTINILKCKYLNTDPQLSEKSTRVEYFNKIGISAFDGLKFKTAKLEYVSQLLEMVKNDDFSPIRSMRFKKDKYETIVNKIKVLYNYFGINVRWKRCTVIVLF